MLPSFVIIGAMKAGTTSLFRYLAAHPDIGRSRMKETDFFTRNHSKGLDWYRSLFSDKFQYTFEASPNYTKRHLFPGVARRMHDALPNAKLIYLVRDPVDRIVSHYMQNYSIGRETRPFDEILKDDVYVKTSQYYYQLEAFLAFYPQEHILLVESERLWSDPLNVVLEVFGFLGVARNDNEAILLEHAHQMEPVKREVAGRKIISKPAVTPVQRECLMEEIYPDTKALREYSGLSFGWAI